MAIRVTMTMSWDDAYPDPDVLERVQQAIDEHVPGDLTLDWSDLRAIRGPHWVRYDISRDDVGALQGELTDLWGRAANSVQQLDIIPFPLFVDFVELGRTPNQWRLVSAEGALRWHHFPLAEQLELERVVQALEAGDMSFHDQDRMTPSAYCRTVLVRVAWACVRYRLPARVYW